MLMGLALPGEGDWLLTHGTILSQWKWVYEESPLLIVDECPRVPAARLDLAAGQRLELPQKMAEMDGSRTHPGPCRP